MDQVNRYLTALEARNYAQTTLTSILSIIKKLLRSLPETSRQRVCHNLARVTADDLDVYIRAARQQELTPSTINYTLSMLKGFFAFLCEAGEMPRQPVIKRRHSLFAPEPLPKPMAEVDLVAFFKVIDSVRDRLLFLLMLRCGLRVSEACAITWHNVDLGGGTALIKNGKGQIDRTAYLSPDVVQTLQLWRARGTTAQYVFPGRFPETSLSRKTAHELMQKYLREAGITKAYSPHCLRHSFATQMLNAGVTLEALKELMGRHSLQMTLRYTQLYESTKRQQYEHAMERIERRQAALGR